MRTRIKTSDLFMRHRALKLLGLVMNYSAGYREYVFEIRGPYAYISFVTTIYSCGDNSISIMLPGQTSKLGTCMRYTSVFTIRLLVSSCSRLIAAMDNSSKYLITIVMSLLLPRAFTIHWRSVQTLQVTFLNVFRNHIYQHIYISIKFS